MDASALVSAAACFSVAVAVLCTTWTVFLARTWYVGRARVPSVWSR